MRYNAVVVVEFFLKGRGVKTRCRKGRYYAINASIGMSYESHTHSGLIHSLLQNVSDRKLH